MQSNLVSTPLFLKLKKIQALFKDLHRNSGLFKEKWNSRTFQGLPLKFKDFSRLCEPCPGVVVTLAEMPESQAKKAVTLEGVSFVNNIQYERYCLRVWRAYDIGPGKIIPWSKFDAFGVDHECYSIVDIGNDHGKSIHLPFVALKPRKVTCPVEVISSDGDDDESASKDGSSNSGLFSCPEEGCVMTYQRHSSLEHHLQCGKHRRVLEQETLLDRAMQRYAYELEKGGSKVEELGDVACLSKDSSCDVQNPPLSIGWALKSSFTRRTRFNSNQKDYLMKKFDIGQKTGRKLVV